MRWSRTPYESGVCLVSWLYRFLLTTWMWACWRICSADFIPKQMWLLYAKKEEEVLLTYNIGHQHSNSIQALSHWHNGPDRNAFSRHQLLWCFQRQMTCQFSKERFKLSFESCFMFHQVVFSLFSNVSLCRWMYVNLRVSNVGVKRARLRVSRHGKYFGWKCRLKETQIKQENRDIGL